ncbi:unnamed protein product, partial [Rotaria sp. Silwood2]
REYYRPKLFKLLEKSEITDKDNLYELALDNVAEDENIPVSSDTSGKSGKLDLIEYIGCLSL